MAYEVPPITRCVICKFWWCKTVNVTKCACGGELEVVDMDEHIKALPKAVDDPPAK